MADESAISSGEFQLESVSVGSPIRRRALWGVLAVVAVAAASLAVLAGGDDGELPRLPVALGSTGAERAAGAPTADAIFAWVTYVAGEDLPVLGGEAAAYRVSGTVDEARVQALAEALGLTGDPVHEDRYWRLQAGDAVLEVHEDGGGSWFYSPTGGAVAEPGAVSGGGAACPPEADCTVPPPIEPQPPADLPSQNEARQIALDLLEATGMDLADAKVTVDGPYDAWYVTVEPRIDGVLVAGWVASVGVGSKGAITTAFGTLGAPERLGDYPLIDTRAAIDRLNEQMGAFDGGPMPLGVADDATRDAVAAVGEAIGAPAQDSAAATGTAEPVEDPVVTTVVTECEVQADGSEVCQGGTSSRGSASAGVACAAVPPTADGDATITTAVPPGCVQPVPLPCPESLLPLEGEATETTVVLPECSPAPQPVPGPEPVPEPESLEVVLTEAERVLVMLAAFDGSGDAYLVPGYRFSNAEGAVVEVAAVADENLVPSPRIPDTTVPESDASEPSVPPPTACETRVEDDGSGTTHTVQTCPPSTVEPLRLEPGQTPELGVPYYVEVTVHCMAIGDFGGRWWSAAETAGDLQEPTGSLTLSTADEGTFSTASGYRVVFRAQGPSSDFGCD